MLQLKEELQDPEGTDGLPYYPQDTMLFSGGDCILQSPRCPLEPGTSGVSSSRNAS